MGGRMRTSGGRPASACEWRTKCTLVGRPPTSSAVSEVMDTTAGGGRCGFPVGSCAAMGVRAGGLSRCTAPFASAFSFCADAFFLLFLHMGMCGTIVISTRHLSPVLLVGTATLPCRRSVALQPHVPASGDTRPVLAMSPSSQVATHLVPPQPRGCPGRIAPRPPPRPCHLHMRRVPPRGRTGATTRASWGGITATGPPVPAPRRARGGGGHGCGSDFTPAGGDPPAVAPRTTRPPPPPPPPVPQTLSWRRRRPTAMAAAVAVAAAIRCRRCWRRES